MYWPTFLFFWLSLEILALGRNYYTGKYRKELIDWIFAQQNWRTLVEEYDKVSYMQMFLKFWRPLDSFYDFDQYFSKPE